MATEKQLQKLQSKLDAGKGQKYASELGLSKKDLKKISGGSSSGSSSGSSGGSSSEPYEWNGKSWKGYDFGKKLELSELNEIRNKYMDDKGYSEIGANNVALKAAARYSQGGGEIGSKAMNWLEGANQRYFVDNGYVGRGGTVGGGGANFWNMYNRRSWETAAASQGKQGGTAFRWTPGTLATGTLEGGRNSWTVGGFSPIAQSSTGKRNQGDPVGNWSSDRGWRYERSEPIEPYNPEPSGKKDGGKKGGGKKGGGGGGGGGGDFGVPETGGDGGLDMSIQGGAGTLAGANAAGIRSRRSSRYRSGLAMKGTQQMNRLLLNTSGLTL